MENRINIAELLKDCPEGMELDCTNYSGVVIFDKVTNDPIYPIRIKVKYGNEHFLQTLTKYGQSCKTSYNKCVIFPKGKNTWEEFVPPCKFKNGDIISNDDYIAIFYKIGTPYHCASANVVYYYCYYSLRYSKFKGKLDFGIGTSNEFKYATEEEKQKLFQAIKGNGYKWNPETKTLEKLVEPKFKVGDVLCDDKRVYRIYDIDDTHYKSIYIQDGNSLCSFFPIHTQDRYMSVNCCFWVGDRITDGNKFIYLIKEVTQTGYILKDLKNTQITFEEARLNFVKVEGKFDITTLKPFDKVLVAYPKGRWHIQFFEKYSPTSKFPFICIGGSVYQKCVPYEENKHLMDTTNDCDEYYKTWE